SEEGVVGITTQVLKWKNGDAFSCNCRCVYQRSSRVTKNDKTGADRSGKQRQCSYRGPSPNGSFSFFRELRPKQSNLSWNGGISKLDRMKIYQRKADSMFHLALTEVVQVWPPVTVLL